MKKILRRRDPFLALMSYRATLHTTTGISPCQLIMGREIRTLLPTLELNLKQVLPSQQAVARKDEETKTTYSRHFDKRHGVRPLPELQPGDSVHVKLDQQKVWKTPGKVIARSPVPRSYIIQTPNSVVRRNRRHLRTVNSPRRVHDRQELDVNMEPRAEGPVVGSQHPVDFRYSSINFELTETPSKCLRDSNYICTWLDFQVFSDKDYKP